MTSAMAHVQETWQARGMLVQIGSRDLRLRYRQTRLGPIWLFVGPLVNALIFTIVFNRIGRIPAEPGTPYFVFALSGLVGWMLFAQVTSRVATSFLGSSSLITRVRFPRLALPGSVMVGATADASIGLVIALVAATSSVSPQRLALGLPGAIASLLAIIFLAWELGLLIAVLAVRRRDLVQGLPIVLQLGLFATPVAYPVSAVPERLRFLVDLNPMATAIGSFRACLIGGPAPTAKQFAIALLVAAGMLVLSLQIFRRVEPCMADIL